MSELNPGSVSQQSDTGRWRQIVKSFQEPSRPRAIWQLTNTLGPYVALWTAMYFCLSISYWLIVPLAILTGLFVVRIFIIFHDCGHRSYFKSARANDVVGFITGMITMTPYFHWRWEHSVHHASAGDLDHR